MSLAREIELGGKARLGYSFTDNFNFYGIFGLSVNRIKYSNYTEKKGINTNCSGDALLPWCTLSPYFSSNRNEGNDWLLGIKAGLGLEYQFTDHLSTRVEYEYTYLGDIDMGSNFEYSNFGIHQINLGLQYNF